MTDAEAAPPASGQAVMTVASIDPAVGVLASGFVRALVNALPFSDSDPDAPPTFRAVRVALTADGFVSVSSTDRVTAFWQPVDTTEQALTLDVLVDRDDARLIADAVKGALRAASESESLTARMRTMDLRSETILRVEVGRRRVDVSCLPTDLTAMPDVGAVMSRVSTGETAPFDVRINAKFLARLAKVRVELKEDQGVVTMTQSTPTSPVRCDLADDIVILLMPIRPREVIA